MKVGIDLVMVSRIEESLASFGGRFLKRVFTDGEIAYATSAPALTSQRLAARFAAKEAAQKALGLAEHGSFFREIEVVSTPQGPELRLHGQARALAGTDDISLSLSHEGDYAAAVVVTQGRK